MVKSLFVTPLVASLFVALAATQESQLRQMARERDVTLSFSAAYEPATFEMVAKRADTVVVGTVLRGTPMIAGEQIVTHYDVRVDRVVRRTRPPGIARGDVLEVRRLGGAMVLEGHNVVGYESNFPQFTIGDTYVLFLQLAEKGTYSWVVYGPRGAFRVDADVVRPFSEKFTSWDRERGNVALRDFIAEVLAVSKEL